MPRYDMRCEACDFTFELDKPIADDFPLRCPECHKHKLYQDYSVPYFAIRQSPKTLGHLAERNSEKMGKYLLEDKRAHNRRIKKEGGASWYNADKKNLPQELSHLDTIEKKQKYIMGGEV